MFFLFAAKVRLTPAQQINSRLLNYSVINGCTSGFMELDLLKRRAGKITNNTGTNEDSLDGEFRLFTESRFNCSGKMTGLLFVGAVRTGQGRDQYPEIQIWRNTNGGMYTRQGGEEMQLAAGDFSPDGVLQYNLTTPISFESEDVLGVYQPPKNASVVRVYYDSSASTTYLVGTMSYEPPQESVNLSGNKGKTVISNLILISPISGQ